MSDSRNPLIFPEAIAPEPKATGCPKCGHPEYNGRRIQGVLTKTCRKCRNQWYGGLPQEPADPRVPVQPLNPADRPAVDFESKKNKNGEREIVEVRNRPDQSQDFRKGAYVPPEGEE